MNDKGSMGALAIFIAIVVAALFLGTLLLRNWLAYQVVSKAVSQPAYAFPTSQVQFPQMLTPWAYQPGIWDYWSTPTPEDSGVYIITR